MKALALAALLSVTGCKAKHDTPPPAAGSGSATGSAPAPTSDDICRRGIEAIDHASCGSGAFDLHAARSSLDGIAGTVQKLGTADPHAYDVMCSRFLDAIDHDAAKAHCTFPLDPAIRARVTQILDAYYAERTPVTQTGDPASDAVIAKVASMRDAACACKDAPCLDKVDEQLVQIAAMPAGAPQTARDLAGKLLDDAARCAQKIRAQ